MEQELESETAQTKTSRNTVTLDQQSTGRLTRMDALQQQAMANASEARRRALRTRIKAARARMDEGEYGYCLECGEEIPLDRLTFDPTLPTCLTCARG
ncbi:MAG: TraR/DksA family transcriptional regulator [Litoreibacter sp.]|nr:TraR/DksA family transcriptional regulator [Litoreibacter sp.]